MLYICRQKGPLINLIVKYVTIMETIKRITNDIYPLQNTKSYIKGGIGAKKGNGFVLNVIKVIPIILVTIGT